VFRPQPSRPHILVPLLALALLGLPATVGASELRFNFVNPTFGGNPLNSTHLYAGADRQNQYKDDGGGSSSSASTSTGDLFAKQLESQLYAALAGQITEALAARPSTGRPRSRKHHRSTASW